MTRWLRSLGSRCAARPLVVVGSWLLVAAVVTVVSMTLGGDYTHSSTLPGTQVQSAEELLARHLPSASHETADVVVQGSGPDGAREATAGVVAAVVRLPHVVPSPPLVRWSADGTTSLVRVEYDTGRYDLGHSALAALRRTVRSARLEAKARPSRSRAMCRRRRRPRRLSSGRLQRSAGSIF